MISKSKLIFFSDHDDKLEIKYKEEIKGYTIARRGAIALVDQRNFTYIRSGKIPLILYLKTDSNCCLYLVLLMNVLVSYISASNAALAMYF